MSSTAVSQPYAFTKAHRLLSPSDFKAVFDDARFKASDQLLLVLSRPNTAVVTNGTPRLGLVIAKKHIRLSVQRNRIKRILRETFRHHQHQLQGIDAVVLARRGLDKLDNAQLHALFSKQWARIIKKAAQAGHHTGAGNQQT